MHLSRNLLIAASLCQFAMAAAPTPVMPNRYGRLWNDSPFTTKPIVVAPITVNPFEDYALGGVTPLEGTYLVTLFNKKKPEERVSIPGNTLGFKVVEVHPGKEGPLSTSVTISNGSRTGTVGFDEKLLVVKVAVPPKQGGPHGVMPGQLQQNQQNQNPNGQPQIQPPVPQPQVQQPSGSPNGQNQGNDGRGVSSRPPRPRVGPVPPTR
ncbi:MAG: hypothetical protein CFE26_20735 [Verrucomicrobiales bacterium VVV1]|nr:MAG: hypothetical protein CFE26_20735 [Verrucomicrobiales bacterium VVV1]